MLQRRAKVHFQNRKTENIPNLQPMRLLQNVNRVTSTQASQVVFEQPNSIMAKIQELSTSMLTLMTNTQIGAGMAVHSTELLLLMLGQCRSLHLLGGRMVLRHVSQHHSKGAALLLFYCGRSITPWRSVGIWLREGSRNLDILNTSLKGQHLQKLKPTLTSG